MHRPWMDMDGTVGAAARVITNQPANQQNAHHGTLGAGAILGTVAVAAAMVLRIMYGTAGTMNGLVMDGMGNGMENIHLSQRSCPLLQRRHPIGR